MSGQHFGILRALSLTAALLSVAGAARAADYLLTATGNFESSYHESYCFDGTTSTDGHLPSLFDTVRLEGGSFVATYRFSTSTPPASGDFTTYIFDSLAGLSYSLLDPQGAVVHVGSNSSEAFAFVFNDNANFGDRVSFFAFVNSVTGLVTPPALYVPVPEIFAIQSDLYFSGDVTSGSDFITSLALPTDAATYLNFSSMKFRPSMGFNDGDGFGLVGDPYQYIESSLQYGITNVTVTAVPEPVSSVVLLVGILTMLFRRRAEMS